MPERILTKAALDGGTKCIDVVTYIFVFRAKILNATKGNKVSTSVKDH